jgi:signal transduction histidine kinase
MGEKGQAKAAVADPESAMEAALLSRRSTMATSFSKGCAAVVFLTGMVVLVGWALDVPALKSIHPSLISMKANTALCFVLIGAALWLLEAGLANPVRLWAGRFCAGLVALVGLLSLGEYLCGCDLHIDQLLFREDAGAVGTVNPGRMAPNTAACFLAIGAALLLRDLRSAAARRSAEFLVHVAGLIGLVAFIGYMYGVAAFTGLAAYTRMAVHTSVAFVVTYVGLMAARPDRGLARMMACDCVGGMVMRRLLPLVIILTVIVGWLRLVGERWALYPTAFGTALRVVVDLLVLTLVIVVTARALHKVDMKRREGERAIIRLNADLQAVNKELEAFSYSASHDLRAPLRAIDGFSQALLEDYTGKLDAEGQGYLQRVRAASQRMAQLIDDLLNLSRITRAEMSRDDVNLTAMAQEVAEELRKAEPGREADVIIAPGLRASGDTRLLRVVLANLLGNAWKFTRNKPRARIEFGRARRGNETAYFVGDDGVGFDMEYVDKLFGAFQRLHSAGEFEGTGIGLATVQRIIHRHGGRVWAEGAVEQGATFYFILP